MSGGSNSYRDLIAWQEAMELTHSVYEVTSHFPEAEKFGLTSQMRRGVVSVASNIAEGQGRNSKGEFIQFLGHARGSLQEAETQLLVAERRKFAPSDQVAVLMKQCDKVRRLLNGLINSLRDPVVSAGVQTGNWKRETRN